MPERCGGVPAFLSGREEKERIKFPELGILTENRRGMARRRESGGVSGKYVRGKNAPKKLIAFSDKNIYNKDNSLKNDKGRPGVEAEAGRHMYGKDRAD